ncbi:MAG: ATP-dependent helicase [Coprococcus sp.]|nr:ATP-dependent helicase [Coprococcus sp.]
MDLNKEQKEAVRHRDGPCMVLAPPGSGKTLTVVRRIQYLIESCNVPARQILVITFTRYAAREMQERFGNLTCGRNTDVTFGTFHSVFYGILKHTYGIGGANLLSEQNSMDMLKDAAGETLKNRGDECGEEEEFWRELRQEIGVVKNGLYRLEDFHSERLSQDEFTQVFRRYESRKKEYKKFDFDDMLVQCYALFKKRPDILKKWQERFTYILIDEFQDINRVQYEVIRMLSLPQNNLFVVGDDDQSIYGFRGANPELMLNMKQDYPDIRIISLTYNYRSTEFIVGAASRVIYHNESRYFKRIRSFKGRGEAVHVQELLDGMEEARFVASEIQKRLDTGKDAGEIAVLYRAGLQANLVSEALSERRIPFEMREHMPNFYEHFVVRDMLSYMKIASGDRRREWFLKIANRPVRYLSRACFDRGQVDFEDIRKFYEEKEWMQDIIDQFELDIKMLENMAPYAQIQYIKKRIGYEAFLISYAAEHQIPCESLKSVVQDLEERSKPFRRYEEFAEHISTYTAELLEQEKLRRNQRKRQRDKVQLMTMHAAKGLEFDTVFVIHANEGETPYQKADSLKEIEEERRMFYVAMTRAREELLISYIVEKNGSSIKLSRFVEELWGRAMKPYSNFPPSSSSTAKNSS